MKLPRRIAHADALNRDFPFAVSLEPIQARPAIHLTKAILPASSARPEDPHPHPARQDGELLSVKLPYTCKASRSGGIE